MCSNRLLELAIQLGEPTARFERISGELAAEASRRAFTGETDRLFEGRFEGGLGESLRVAEAARGLEEAGDPAPAGGPGCRPE